MILWVDKILHDASVGVRLDEKKWDLLRLTERLTTVSYADEEKKKIVAAALALLSYIKTGKK